MDAQSGTVLFEKAADEAVAPASVSKLMTAELVFRDLKKGAITLDTPFSVSERAWRTGSKGTSMFAKVNTGIRVEDLLRGLIVQSGNDAAITLAEGLAGSEENFVGMMNERAKEIGLTKSHFTDSWGGDDPAQRVSARDIATLAEYLIATYPDYYHFFGEKEFTWSKIRQLNRNPILFMDFNADGLKVGNLAESGYNLVGSAPSGGQRLIVVILDAKTAKDRAEEAHRLFNWGFHGFDSRTLFEAGEKVGAAKVFGGAASEAPLVSDTPIRLMTPRGSSERLSGKIIYTGPLIAPVEAGETVARLKIYRGTMLALDVPLKTGATVEQGPLAQRAKDAALELGLQLFHKGLSKAMRTLDHKPETASAPATAP
jgi:D-alanyl-D-alanine carboxypeptidase (penicillin-binding protein 5/6)